LVSVIPPVFKSPGFLFFYDLFFVPPELSFPSLPPVPIIGPFPISMAAGFKLVLCAPPFHPSVFQFFLLWSLRHSPEIFLSPRSRPVACFYPLFCLTLSIIHKFARIVRASLRGVFYFLTSLPLRLCSGLWFVLRKRNHGYAKHKTPLRILSRISLNLPLWFSSFLLG